jgi:uncharacterized cupin superfamily protein
MSRERDKNRHCATPPWQRPLTDRPTDSHRPLSYEFKINGYQSRQPVLVGARMGYVRRMKTFNLNSDEWDGTRDRDGWRISAALVGQRIGGELIGATMSEVEPGSKLWPYHTHYLNEEWVIVLRGEPTLRTPEGEHVLKEGAVVCCPRGKDGAHQIINRTDSPIRVLMLSSMTPGEVIEYLDTGKVLAKDAKDDDIMFAKPGPAVEYWEDEE